MSNDGHCIVCDVLGLVGRVVDVSTVKTVLRAYIDGLEDEGVAQRDRFCLTHRATFDAMLRSEPELAAFDPFSRTGGL